MKIYTRGNYLGSSIESISYGDITLSRTVYHQHEAKDWHCHVNPFFAYFLKGGNKEYRTGSNIDCGAGTLLFYNAGEIHRNDEYVPGSSIFHVEVSSSWFLNHSLSQNLRHMQTIQDPEARHTLINIMREFALQDDLSASSVEALLTYLWNNLSRNKDDKGWPPRWKRKFEMVAGNEEPSKLTLEYVSACLGMHPVTLSKEFPKVYRCSFGTYMRERRLEKALRLLARKSIPIATIAEACGFSDAASFTRSFKRSKNLTPDGYRKML